MGGSYRTLLALLLGVSYFSTLPVGSRSANDVEAEFLNPNAAQDGMPFEKMVVDPSTGRVYVGAVNNLYELFEDTLKQRARVSTGPEDDSVDCPGRGACGTRRTQSNAYTKSLAIYPGMSKLIECTSLFQGRCRLRNLYDIAQTDVQKESQPIVANDRESATVAFVAQGPADAQGPPPNVLYIASTYVTNSGHFRDDVPTVASLSLDNERLFEVAVQGVGTGTELKLERKYRGQYKIDYIGGFHSGRFAYFVTRQPKGDTTQGQWPVISKLVRVCTGDKHFWSYTEVPLECNDKDGQSYNLVSDVYLGKPGYDLAESLGVSTEDDVIYAVFVRGAGGSEKSAPTRESALCVYSIKQIEAKFLENIELCFKGEASKNLPWFKSTDMCLKTQFSGQEVVCGKDVNSYIGGEIAVQATAALTTKDAQYASIATNTTHSATVAFIGTKDGRLLKAVIERKDQAFVYRTLELSAGKPILQDMELDGEGEFLYVMTPDSVSKVKVRQCDDLAVCTTCLEQRDPYCGWCVLDNKCTPESVCRKSGVASSSAAASVVDWLSYKTGQCTTIRSVEPNQLQITAASFLTLKLDNLPNVAGDLTCQFRFPSGLELSMAAESKGTEVEGTLRCPTPGTPLLPSIPSGEHSLLARLSVIHEAGPPLATTNFTFFDCGRYDSCSGCVSSDFPCDWCVESNQCVSGTTTENKCRAQHIINGVTRTGPSRRKGPSFCPHVVASSGDIYVASGVSKTISVQAKNVLDFMTDFKCRFEIDHSVFEKAAKRVAETITCEEFKFEYFGLGAGNGTAVAQFSVVWSQGDWSSNVKMLDNNQGIRMIMYKCESLASNCGLCLALDATKFECGWCSADKACSRQDKCTAPTLDGAGGWLDRSELCPSPRITDFSPKKGPISGGTKVTIDGINLGRDYVDVSNAVSTANVKCDVQQAEYVTSTRIVCVTKESVHLKPASNPIIVKLKDDMAYTAISDANFEYVDPSITGFEPRRGPQSGGTDVTIRGQNLDAGSSATAFIGSHPCAIIKRSDTQMVCRTGPAGRAKLQGHLKVTFDVAVKEFVSLQFEYEKDPKVTSVRPEKSIAAGGVEVEVRGTSFDLIQRPHMVVVESDAVVVGPPCRIESAQLMYCKTPNLRIPLNRRLQPTIDHPLMLDYGFEFNGVRTGNLSQDSGFQRLSVFPDPIIDRFADNRVKYFRQDDYLTINGRYIDAAAAERDVSVTIGTEPCNLTALANRALTCQPPSSRPTPRMLNSAHPEVVVTIGGKQYDVGYLSYDAATWSLSIQVIVAIAAAVAVFIVAFVLLLLAYRRKTTSHTRQMKTLKTQMDTIEMKVAAECKEAFAELQTHMSAMAADAPLGTPIIPFLSYRDYATQVLFPNSVNHPVLRELEVDSTRATQIESALRLFNQLLLNKTFLLTFVRTMEANKYFLSKDRVYVGSLLMVVLQEKMEYCTDVLKTLLEDLIERTVERRFQPKILFRRSESVAERMLAAWFTFLMHHYLQECAGQPLFMLYWAIKQQMEKGPQDAITLEARYSLSEEKLLRSSFDFKELTVFVSSDSNAQANADFPVRVLDCDTITQVKEKCLDAMYRTTPYSHRPSANDLDLEWRTGGSGRLLLQDLDVTSKAEVGGWKKLNTLAHYKVPTNSNLALLPRQASLYNLSLLSERSEKSSTFSLKNSPTLTRPFGTNHSHHHHHSKDPESGYKLYHLVKPTEHGPNDHQEKMVSEIYLTRLLTMKGTLQKFIEDLLLAVFSTAMRSSTLPMCIKYMFDFMDEQALVHGINDPEVVHAWKSNALPLRFWVNLIKNPHFVFDVQKPTKIEGCLSVVAQTLMDACSTQDHQLTKDSPSSKLLFAKDIYEYRKWVDDYYQQIKQLPPVSDQDMSAFLADESRTHQRQFYVFSALNELYKYLDQYKEQIGQALEEDEFAQRNRVTAKYHQMLHAMDGDSPSLNLINNHPREDRV